MKNYIDLTDQTFGKLRVIGRGLHEKSGNIEWLCECSCGTKKVIPSGSLRKGKVKSCGCLRKSAPQVKDVTGHRSGRLTVVKFVSMNPNRTSNWLCRCDCGNEKVVRKGNLNLTGKPDPDLEKTYSCGCQKSAHVAEANKTHGELIGLNVGGANKQTKEYSCWQRMIYRCYNPKSDRYDAYGAKGVTVCDEWRNDFAQFLADVGRAPADKPCIDRINPFGNYEPGNVRWVDWHTSNTNKRSNYTG